MEHPARAGCPIAGNALRHPVRAVFQRRHYPAQLRQTLHPADRRISRLRATAQVVEDVLPADAEAAALLGVEPDARFEKFDEEPDNRRIADLFHPNDVEELSAELAPKFPMFEAGDLLISIRRMNLVAVIDGTDYRFKWWSHGPWISQHDPDFTDDGLISVYNNNTERGPSNILRIDPATRELTVLPAAPGAGWHSPFMGNHQYLPNGNILITESRGGRVFEVTPAGKIVWEFVHRFDEDRVVLTPWALRYPSEMADFPKDCPADAGAGPNAPPRAAEQETGSSY